MAYYFGTTLPADHFGLAFSAAALASLVLTEGSFATGFAAKSSASRIRRYAGWGLGGYALVGAISWLAAPSLRGTELLMVLLVLGPSVLSAPWIGEASARLTMAGRVSYTNAVQVLFNVGALAGLSLPAFSGTSPNVLWVAIGWSVGNVAAAAVLTRASTPADSEVAGSRHLSAVTLAAALMSSQALVDRLAAAGVGEGAIAALGYAERIMLIPAGFVLAAFGPLLIHESLRDHLGERHARRRLRQLNLLTVPASLVLFGFAPRVVSALLDRGRFSDVGEDLTVAATQGLVAGIPATCLMLASVRLMQSRGEIKPLIAGAAAGAGANLVLSVSFGRMFGVGGIAAATTLAAVLTCVIQSWRLRTRGLGQWQAPSIIAPTIVTALLCGGVRLLSNGADNRAGGEYACVILAAAAFLLLGRTVRRSA